MSRTSTKRLACSPTVYRLTAPGQSATFQRGERIRIGRHPENDIVLESASVSRFHARIEWPRRPGPPLIIDLGSSNGTFIDGVRRARAPLSELSKLVVGDVRLSLLRVDPSPVEASGATRVRLFDDRWPDSTGYLRAAEGVHALLLELERSGRTAAFTLSDEQGVQAQVTFSRGRIVHATTGGARGVDALRALLARPMGGRYTVTKEVESQEAHGVALPRIQDVLARLTPLAS